MSKLPRKPLKIAILAMGGQGGGVLANWLIEAAGRAGYLAQSTAVPGVAQRTGATIYYLEIAPKGERAGDQPVLALMPVPGHVDVVIAGELVEAGRAVLRGLITRERTVAIVSTHRDYAIDEKTAPGDGRVDSERIATGVDASAKRFVGFDMAALAEETGSVISSVLLGAIAGAGALPVGGEIFREVVRAMGVAVDSNLKGFEAGYRGAAPQSECDAEINTGNHPNDIRKPESNPHHRESEMQRTGAPGTDLSNSDSPVENWEKDGLDRDARSLLDRVRETFPEGAWEMLTTALRRLIDYQDPGYAADYLDRLQPVCELDNAHRDYRLTRATARYLALGMTYEDVIRVADLKTRSQRFTRIREEVRADEGQVVAIEEYLHPRVEEVCDLLPARVGAWCMKTAAAKRYIGWFCRKGRRIRTTSLTGFLLLYLIAQLRRLRRGTLRFNTELAALQDWLTLIARTARDDYELAVEVAECRRLVKGYGETHARGLANYHRLIAEVNKHKGALNAAATIKRLRDRALSDIGESDATQ